MGEEAKCISGRKERRVQLWQRSVGGALLHHAPLSPFLHFRRGKVILERAMIRLYLQHPFRANQPRPGKFYSRWGNPQPISSCPLAKQQESECRGGEKRVNIFSTPSLSLSPLWSTHHFSFLTPFFARWPEPLGGGALLIFIFIPLLTQLFTLLFPHPRLPLSTCFRGQKRKEGKEEEPVGADNPCWAVGGAACPIFAGSFPSSSFLSFPPLSHFRKPFPLFSLLLLDGPILFAPSFLPPSSRNGSEEKGEEEEVGNGAGLTHLLSPSVQGRTEQAASAALPQCQMSII